jgi:diguanylate cyclase (GGDEF)-like protein
MFNLWNGQKNKNDGGTKALEQENGNLSLGESTSGPSSTDQATETVAKILRIFGRHSFDIDKGSSEGFAKEFERWARHVLLGISPTEDSDSDNAGTDGKRNWGGVCQFVNRHRQQEKNYVVKGFQDLREVIWTFTMTLSQAFLQDKGVDEQMVSHIGRLKAAVDGKSPDELKREVLMAAEGLGKLVEDRSQQQRYRLTSLGEKLKEVEEELGNARKQMALDPLTQLYNRAALDQQIDRVRALSIISESPACLLMVDIDHFKNINDSYGHRAGDTIIRELANRTVLTFPRKTDFVARYGGEEFAVLLQGDSAAVGRRLAGRLLDVVQQTSFQHEDLELSITVSIGMAELIPGEEQGIWVERADQALYRAKNNGRNQLCDSLEIQC